MTYTVSPAPHVRNKMTTQNIMATVIAALIPTTVAAVWLFGWAAVRVLAISVVSCVGFELLANCISKKRLSINDLSAAVTGLILGLNLPSTAPWWMILVGSAVAILLVKQLFGGLGCNFLNPALAGRAVLLASWPARMTGFVTPTGFSGVDAVSAATPLADSSYSMLDMFVGRIPGSLGEVCKIAILLGLVYLLVTGVVTWHVPVAFIGSFLLFAWIFGFDPVRAVLTGGVLFGAVFMATDYVTNPMTRAGQLVFGVGCGLIVAVIRRFGSYPEGVTYAILLMNIVTPLIDRCIKPRVYGEVKEHA